MNLVKSVFDLANSFMQKSKHVSIDYDVLKSIAQSIKKSSIPSWPKKIIERKEDEVLKLLVKNSINYCYWYGRSDIRSNDSSASKLGKIIDKYINPQTNFELSLDIIKKKIIEERFPLIEERLKHLEELRSPARHICSLLPYQNNGPAESWMKILIEQFPGYGSDLFLKRASLFFLELYRTFGWFENDMFTFPVPADYQVPKLLKSFGILRYSYSLEEKIRTFTPIIKHSIEECEIRSATILACNEFVKETGFNISDIDSYFWLNRDKVNSNFHLTETTDY
jgi:hypothetical protein